MPHKKVYNSRAEGKCPRYAHPLHTLYNLIVSCRNFVSIEMLCTSVYIEFVNVRHTVCIKAHQQVIIAVNYLCNG